MLMFWTEMGLSGLGAALLAYLVYALFFSKGAADHSAKPKVHRRFDRRQPELGARRQKSEISVTAEEKRKNTRR